MQKLVVKPDQLIKRRGKLGLIKVNASFGEVKTWVGEKMGVDMQIGKATGKLKRASKAKAKTKAKAKHGKKSAKPHHQG